MSDRRIIPLLGGRAVLAENGPLRMVIQAWQGPEPCLEPAMEAAKYAFDCLKQVAGQLAVLKQRAGDIHKLPLEPISRQMIASVRAVGDAELTPMAAVAGTLADAVADRLFGQGLSRVIVDNGGDIAIRLAEGETIRVGLRPEIQHQQMSHVLTLDGRHSSWGVCTSGLGGEVLPAALPRRSRPLPGALLWRTQPPHRWQTPVLWKAQMCSRCRPKNWTRIPIFRGFW